MLVGVEIQLRKINTLQSVRFPDHPARSKWWRRRPVRKQKSHRPQGAMAIFCVQNFNLQLVKLQIDARVHDIKLIRQATV